jgi:hypothetical protein
MRPIEFTGFVIIILLSLPIHASLVLAEISSYNLPTTNFTTLTGLPELSQSCLDKKERGEAIIDIMDNDVIAALTGVVEVMTAICTIYSIIAQFVDDLLIVAKGICVVTTCEQWIPKAFWMYPVCTSIENVHRVFHVSSNPFTYICCFINCGFVPWCNSANFDCTNGIFGSVGDALGGQLPSIYGYDFRITAGENIFTAIACLCPAQILIQLRKLKLIYQTYNCCIERACQAGQSTVACERALSEQLCMYWEGSLMKSLIGILIDVISYIIMKVLLKLIEQYLSLLIPLLNCLASLWELVQIPRNIEQLQDTWEDLTDTNFGSVDCDELDPDDIAQYQPDLRERYESTRIIDIDFLEWDKSREEAETSAPVQEPEPFITIEEPEPLAYEEEGEEREAQIPFPLPPSKRIRPSGSLDEEVEEDEAEEGDE